MTHHLNPNFRHDFVLLFDVLDGNPNGDPDGGNLPRTDPETSHGLVTDVCLKRKIRNYIATYSEYEATPEEAARLKIFVEHYGVLNDQIRRAYTDQNMAVSKPVTEPVKDDVAVLLREISLPSAFTFTDGENSDAEDVVTSLEYSGELTTEELKEQLNDIEILVTNKKLRRFIDSVAKKAGKPKKDLKNVKKAQEWMCNEFYDVRMFGAVMSTGLNAGQVRGPVQLTFGRSQDPVQPQDLAVTRVAVTDPKDRQKQQTIGRKTLIPYGLYRTHGFYSACLANQTGVNETDLELFWQALVKMWDFDRSASRGLMAPRGLYIFSHESKLGNAPAHKLFERIQIQRNRDTDVPRQFNDYKVEVDESNWPQNVHLTRLVEG